MIHPANRTTGKAPRASLIGSQTHQQGNHRLILHFSSLREPRLIPGRPLLHPGFHRSYIFLIVKIWDKGLAFDLPSHVMAFSCRFQQTNQSPPLPPNPFIPLQLLLYRPLPSPPPLPPPLFSPSLVHSLCLYLEVTAVLSHDMYVNIRFDALCIHDIHSSFSHYAAPACVALSGE